MPKNYLQLLMEDMPYLQVMQGAKSSQYNQSTAALQDIFSALGMSIDNYGIYDSWSTRGAVNAIMDTNGKGNTYKDYSPTDADFYSRLREIIMAVGTMNNEEIATVRGGMRTLQKFYSNSFYQGQKEYERQQALIQAALREQEQRRQQEIEAAKANAIASSSIYSPLVPSRFINQTIHNNSLYMLGDFSFDTAGKVLSGIDGGFDIFSSFMENEVRNMAYQDVLNTTRPNNIGVGTWGKIVSKELNRIDDITLDSAKKLSTVSTYAGGASLAFDVVGSIQNDLQQGESSQTIIANALAEFVYDFTEITVSSAVGVAISFFGTPTVGAIATVATGIAFENNTQWLKDWLKDSSYDLVGLFY